MDVWVPILPMQATEMAHPDIHTWLDAVSKRDEFLHVCLLLPMQAEEIELQEAILSSRRQPPSSIHPYIHTYILSFRQFGFRHIQN